MEGIRAWGKKVVIVLNKIDLLRKAGSLDGVLSFVRAEQKKTATIQEQVTQLNSAVISLQSEIEQIRE